jgi:hypothetical protein
MKKTLTLLVAIFATLSGYASHLMGGQITAAWLGTGYDYQISMTLYRDTVGIPMYSTEDINISIDTINGMNPNIMTVSVPPSVSFGNGVEEYTYQINVPFPVAGDYIVYWNNCCRNAAILNLPAPSGNGMLLYTKVHVDSTNSTPVFLNPPIPIAQVGVPFTYNSLPFDADGDSLSWRLEAPLDQNANTTGGLLINPIPGYVHPFSDTSMPFALDASTSEISFLPNTLGHFVVSLAVDEFRNGVKIGEIRRDMQIIVLGSNNSPRLFNFTSNIAPVSNRVIPVTPNTTLHMAVTVSDPTDNDLLSISAAGRAFLLQNPPVFNTYPLSNGSVGADLTWTPTVNEGSNMPYVTSFRIGETHAGSTFYRDETFQFTVSRSVGIEDILAKGNAVWNYSNGLITGDLNMSRSADATIALYSIDGKKVAELFNGNLEAGRHRFAYDAHSLTQGIYLVCTQADNQSAPAQKIVINY